MTQQMMTALAAAFATLLLAALAWLTAKVQTNTAAVRAHQAVLSALARATGTRVEGGARPVGGGAGGRAAPLWNQLADPGSTGQLPPQRFNDCGEECAAETIYRQHGVEVDADYLRWQLRGATGTGVTDGADLVKLLARNNVPAQAESVPAAEIAARIQEITRLGGQVIALGNWVLPSALHWILVTSADTKGCGANDPWGGVRRTWTWSAFATPYAGQCVAITRTPDA